MNIATNELLPELNEHQLLAFEAAASLGITPVPPARWHERPDALVYLTVCMSKFRAGEIPFAYIGSHELNSGSLRKEVEIYKGKGYLLWNSIKKRGWSDFVTVPVEIVEDWIDRYSREQFWLDEYDCAASPLFYNMKNGAVGWTRADRMRTIEKLGPERLSSSAKKANETRGPEGRSAVMKKSNETRGPEGRSAAAKKAKETVGPEARSAASKKGRKTLGPEGRSASGKKSAKTKGPDAISATAKKRVETIIRNISTIKSEIAELLTFFQEGNPHPELLPRRRGHHLSTRKWRAYRDALAAAVAAKDAKE